jgi:glutathione synthase
MRFLVVMDRPETLNARTDTTLVLIAEAHRRQHEVELCAPTDLMLSGPEVLGDARRVDAVRLEQPCFDLGPVTRRSLSSYDAVLMRKDPPFDLDYYFATLLLERARGQTFLVNDPRSLRDANEKLYIFNFPDFIVPTCVTRSVAELRAFMAAEGGEMIVKPLNRCGGAGVLHVRQNDRNAQSMLELVSDCSSSLVMAQRYIAGARKGDKRIILLNGDPIGAVLRVPPEHELRGNLHVGGIATKTTLDERDRLICATVGPRVKSDGLYLVGLDVLDGWLTEVNVTSPTGVREINRLDGVALEAKIVDFLEHHP